MRRFPSWLVPTLALTAARSKQQEIGFTKAELTKFSSTLDGKKPTFYGEQQ